MWREGSLKIHDSIFHYWMKQYDESSQFGIEGGRISKLTLKRNGTIVCNYDRGWDIEPADLDTQLALVSLRARQHEPLVAQLHAAASTSWGRGEATIPAPVRAPDARPAQERA